MNNTTDYMPENPAEELFELVGRLKAFKAYVNQEKYSIEREIIAAMLGFELKEDTKDVGETGDHKVDV